MRICCILANGFFKASEMNDAAYEATQRMIGLGDGRRTGIKLDRATWKAIEFVAAQLGTTWRKWCAEIIETTPTGRNVTAAIRSAAIECLLRGTILDPDRGEHLAAMERNSLMRDSCMHTDETLNEALEKATVHGSGDEGGYGILFGVDEFGRDFVVIKNGLRDGLHFALVGDYAGAKP
jgi:predicted DNA-binding ribbon-helix-helix protein